MRARRVKGLDPDGWLAEGARRIALVRLDELLSFAGAARDPARKRELHDMRIAAKRLRYLLELHEPVFGPTARRAAKTARELQELLGEIHDCDELAPLIRRHQRMLRAEDAAAVAATEPPALAPTPNAERYRGLETLRALTRARRARLHARFVERWDELSSQDFAGKLEWDLERATAKAMERVGERRRREDAERATNARGAALEARAREEAERLSRRLAGEDADTIAPTAPAQEPAGGEGVTQR